MNVPPLVIKVAWLAALGLTVLIASKALTTVAHRAES